MDTDEIDYMLAGASDEWFDGKNLLSRIGLKSFHFSSPLYVNITDRALPTGEETLYIMIKRYPIRGIYNVRRYLEPRRGGPSTLWEYWS